jgi:ATP/maltotriose-dependent transcriptional regulator MalT
LLAEEFEVAVSLLQHFSFEHLFRRENVRLLLDLHERQGEELTFGTPQLVGLITAALLFAGRFDQAAACIEQLVRFTPAHGCPATATAGALAGAARLVAAFAGADGSGAHALYRSAGRAGR